MKVQQVERLAITKLGTNLSTNETVNAVWIQNVLEHILDSWQVVSEIHSSRGDRVTIKLAV